MSPLRRSNSASGLPAYGRSLRGLLVALLLLLGVGTSRASDSGPELEVLSTAHYRIEFPAALAGFGRTLAERVEGWHARIFAELGADPSGSVTLSLLSDEREMMDLVAVRHRGSHPPEWASGLAFPATRDIFVRADVGPDELWTTAQHEISHIAMGAAAGPGRVPTWFTEGVAIRQSEPLATERMWMLTQAALVDRLLPLDQLNRGFPAGGGRAGIAYAQAVHFIGYLVGEYGEARFHTLMRALAARDEPFEDAVAATYGRPLAAIEADWRETLSFWWGWIPVVLVGTSFWVLLGLLLAYAWRRRRRDQRRRIRDMAGAEAMDMAEDIEIAHDLRPPARAHDPYQGRPPSIH